MKGACSIPKKKLIQLFIIIPIAALALLYGSGYLSQLFSNYRAWQEAGAVFGTTPAFPDAGFVPCLAAAFHFPYGLYGLGLCIGALALLILMVMRMGYSEGGEYDRRRNLVYSNKGTYGTAGFMSRKELAGVLDLVPDIRKHSDTFCQGCLRTFFAVIQNQTLDFVAHGFFARFTEMDFDAVGGLSDFLYHYRWRGFLYGQRGSGCGGAAVAGVVVHRLSFP